MHQNGEGDRQDHHHEHSDHEQRDVQQTLISATQTSESVADIHGLSSVVASAAFGFFFTPASSGHLSSSSSTYFWRVGSLTTWLTLAIFELGKQRCSAILVDRSCASLVVGMMPFTRTWVRSTSSSSISCVTDIGIAFDSSTITSNASMCGIGSGSSLLFARSIASATAAGSVSSSPSSCWLSTARFFCRSSRSRASACRSAQLENRKLTKVAATKPASSGARSFKKPKPRWYASGPLRRLRF